MSVATRLARRTALDDEPHLRMDAAGADEERTWSGALAHDATPAVVRACVRVRVGGGGTWQMTLDVSTLAAARRHASPLVVRHCLSLLSGGLQHAGEVKLCCSRGAHLPRRGGARALPLLHPGGSGLHRSKSSAKVSDGACAVSAREDRARGR